ncbi:Uncharacterised protein [Salmonella enterica]|nr:Uncharacterised protein [Salmonella enterica]
MWFCLMRFGFHKHRGNNHLLFFIERFFISDGEWLTLLY